MPRAGIAAEIAPRLVTEIAFAAEVPLVAEIAPRLVAEIAFAAEAAFFTRPVVAAEAFRTESPRFSLPAFAAEVSFAALVLKTRAVARTFFERTALAAETPPAGASFPGSLRAGAGSRRTTAGRLAIGFAAPLAAGPGFGSGFVREFAAGFTAPGAPGFAAGPAGRLPTELASGFATGFVTELAAEFALAGSVAARIAAVWLPVAGLFPPGTARAIVVIVVPVAGHDVFFRVMRVRLIPEFAGRYEA